MKKRIRSVLVGLALVAVVIAGARSYRKLTQIDLQSGMLRVQWRLFEIPFRTTTPRDTPLSLALHHESSIHEWFTVAEQDFDFPPYTRISFHHDKLMTQIRRFDQGFEQPKATAQLAKFALQELNQGHDFSATARHMERVCYQFLSSDELDFSDAAISAAWEITRTEQAAASNRY